MAGDAAERGRVVVVHLADERPSAAAIVGHRDRRGGAAPFGGLEGEGERVAREVRLGGRDAIAEAIELHVEARAAAVGRERADG